jgi:2-polyprenyl-3-methyl-5-hydroxy-6-metoxy-1,4-benzoquinol methylase
MSNPYIAALTEHHRAALEARIRRQYATVCETYRFADLSLPFTRVVDPDEMLQQMEGEPAPTGESKKTWQPYWAELWECSFVVAETLAGRDLSGMRLLDVGCGLGLTGTVAAAKGAWVTMIDAAHPALLFARLNSWPWRDRVRIRRLDWRHERLAGQPFDLIVGADVVYDRDDWPFLEAFWRNHLLAHGTLLLGEGGRSTGAEFVGWLAGRGWHVARTEITDARFHRPIRLVEARFKSLGYKQG